MWPFKQKDDGMVKIHPSTLVGYLGWRNNMWVMTPDGVGVLFKLGTESDVHLTDKDGITVDSKSYPILALRQAKFLEIPTPRRGFSKQTAANLGYF